MMDNKLYMAMVKYLDKRDDDFIRTELAGEGGPGSGNFGHAGRPGKIGGSISGKSNPYVVVSYHEWPDGVTNSKGFEHKSHSSYSNGTDSNSKSKRFNKSSMKKFRKENTSEYTDQELTLLKTDYKRAFNKAKKLARKDVDVNNVTEDLVYLRLQEIDKMMPDNIVITRRDGNAYLAKHELVREYTEEFMNYRFASANSAFKTDYSPWNSKAVSNRLASFDSGDMSKEFAMDVSDDMARSYSSFITGVTKGYDQLEASGAMDAFGLIDANSPRLQTVTLKEISNMYNNTAENEKIAGICNTYTGSVEIYGGSNMPADSSIHHFAETVIHESAHQMHGLLGGTRNLNSEPGVTSAKTAHKNFDDNYNALSDKSFRLDKSDTSSKTFGTIMKSDYDEYMSNNVMNTLAWPTNYSRKNSKEFFAECYMNYVSPAGVLNPNNLSKLPSDKRDAMKDLSKWIENMVDLSSNGNVKPLEDWNLRF